MILSEIVTWTGQLITEFISTAGYPGVLILMALESMIFPVPSELVMPFAGFLATTGRFDLVAVIVVSVIGSLMGSFLSYAIGREAGLPFIQRFGKYVFLDESHLRHTETWFAKEGEKAIFIGRFIPVVRHLISIPAGAARMDPLKFGFFTGLGALSWNAALAIAGYWVGQNWAEISHWLDLVSIVFAVGFVAVIGWWFWSHWKKNNRKADSPIKQQNRNGKK